MEYGGGSYGEGGYGGESGGIVILLISINDTFVTTESIQTSGSLFLNVNNSVILVETIIPDNMYNITIYTNIHTEESITAESFKFSPSGPWRPVGTIE